MSRQLKLVPMWPDPARGDHVERVDAASVGEGRGAGRRRSVERADALELGGHVRSSAHRLRCRERPSASTASAAGRSAAASASPVATSRSAQHPVVRVVDVEALVALGEERHDARRRRSCRCSSDDARPGDLEARVLHVDRRQRLVLACCATAAVAGLHGSSGVIRLAAHTHILPGCCAHCSTARSESTPVAAPRSCVPGAPDRRRRAERAGRPQEAKQSHVRPVAASSSSVCSTHSMSGDVSPAIAAGRRNGTSAP